MANMNRQPRAPSSGGAYYPGKVPRPRTFQMTSLGNDILDATISRTGRSIGDVFERLLREHLHAIAFEDDPVETGSVEPESASV